MILDFTDCKTVEEVNAKWLTYTQDMPQYKKLVTKIKETLEK